LLDNHLIPRIPQRINYILWLEDLLKTENDNKKDVKGIDIGCGGSCVFPLIACSMNPNWSMIGSDICGENVKQAILNVDKNSLSNRIKSELNIKQKKKMILN
jgi:23S rRNA A1618 N6-methylase RlmF